MTIVGPGIVRIFQFPLVSNVEQLFTALVMLLLWGPLCVRRPRLSKQAKSNAIIELSPRKFAVQMNQYCELEANVMCQDCMHVQKAP